MASSMCNLIKSKTTQLSQTTVHNERIVASDSPHRYDVYSRPAVFTGLLEHELTILFSTLLQFALPAIGSFCS